MTSDNGIGLSSFLSSRCVALPSSKPLCQLPIYLPPRPCRGSPGARPKTLDHPWDLLSKSGGAPGQIASSGIVQDGCRWALPGMLSLCPALCFLLPPSPWLPSYIPQPAANFEDLTGTYAVHWLHINPLRRVEFCPGQVMSSSEFCFSSVREQETPLTWIWPTSQLHSLMVNPADERYE